MPSPDSKTRARAELVDLTESQLNTLEKKTLRHNRRRTLRNTRTGATAFVSSTLHSRLTKKQPQSLLRLTGGYQE